MPNAKVGVSFVPRIQPKGNDNMSNEEQQVREIFGPTSNSLKAAQMAKHQPDLYAKLKQAACYSYNIVPEAMLPRSSQLTREQREAKIRSEVAAQKDETFQLPEPLAGRLGLPSETRVSWSTLQKLLGRENVTGCATSTG